MATQTPHSTAPGENRESEAVPFILDLTRHEIRRLSAVLQAIPDWDPAVVLAQENEAYALLYSSLDAEQLAIYDLLCAEGVLDVRR
jgi:hypothetical protein